MIPRGESLGLFFKKARGKLVVADQGSVTIDFGFEPTEYQVKLLGCPNPKPPCNIPDEDEVCIEPWKNGCEVGVKISWKVFGIRKIVWRAKRRRF